MEVQEEGMKKEVEEQQQEAQGDLGEDVEEGEKEEEYTNIEVTGHVSHLREGVLGRQSDKQLLFSFKLKSPIQALLGT